MSADGQNQAENGAKVLFPLRPTLLVISAVQPYEAGSLAEMAARHFSDQMQRLTGKFTKRNWSLNPVDFENPDAMQGAWESLETKNMAIMTGFSGTKAENDVLDRLKQAANPVSTLVILGQNATTITPDGLTLFNKSLSMMDAPLQDIFAFTTGILKQTRHEQSWGAKADPVSAEKPAVVSPKYLN